MGTAIPLFLFLLALHLTRRHLSYNAKFKGHILSDAIATETSQIRKTAMFLSDNLGSGISVTPSFVKTHQLARNLLRIKDMLVWAR